MFTACWSVKGGVGVSVVAAALAVRSAARRGSSLLVDLGGDQPDLAGLACPPGAGLQGWLAAVARAGATGSRPPGLDPLEVELAPGVALLARGEGPLDATSASTDALVSALAAQDRPVIVDCGTPISVATGPAGELALAIAGAATRSLLVTRPCILALKRAVVAPLRPSGVVVVVEEGRALTIDDVADVLGVPVVAEIRLDPGVARAVDAGLLLTRTPAPLVRGLRHVA